MNKWAGICYSKLPYLQKNSSGTNMWYAYFKSLLRNANIILNELFEDYQAACNLDVNGKYNQL